MDENNQQNEGQQDQGKQNQQTPPEPTPSAGGQGEGNEKVIAALAYILFFLPLIVNPEDEFGKFHANQGLNLLITGVVVNLLWIIPILGWIVAFFGSFFVLVLAIMGFVNALNGKEKELPVIGGYRLIN